MALDVFTWSTPHPGLFVRYGGQWRRSGSVWHSWRLKATLQHLYTSENPDFFAMKVRVHIYNSDQFACFLHSQNTIGACCLSDWSLLDSPENDRLVRTLGFAKLFYTPLGGQIIHTLSHCGTFWCGVKNFIVAWAVLSYVPACHFTLAAKTGKQSADIK